MPNSEVGEAPESPSCTITSVATVPAGNASTVIVWVVLIGRDAELARIALSHLGADGRVTVLETGEGARARLLGKLGAEVVVVRTRAELRGLR